ncbi:hypothetical protein B9Q11_02160 [Candidatus Marsarchaeota G2 archaeon ECH_B_SAG-F08]|uniref:Amino acid permease/ SLC12A domain-containing protein n=1 Tax=Candidatus Marsarchaeota G2 archaeon ECH_B_SAG-F08 TaxID=1978165 RepID=A0A2R6BIP6_9ARCH|nr:MAG: hypothetical protein B9Q11_02160 [Candidatus Marsarchaeota G2 archaeon ECH_B_SAG-F08]
MKLSKPSVFVREATGLVKSLGPWTLFFANVGEVGFGTTLLLLNQADSFFPNGNPGGNVVVATLIFTLLTLFEAYIYYKVVRHIGRTAGDYVWISRTLGPIPAGFLLLGFTFTGMPFVAIQLNWLITLSLYPALSSIGAVSGVSSLSQLAISLSSQASLIILPLVLLGVITLVDVVSPKIGYLLLGVMVGIAMLGTLMMLGVFVYAGASGVKSSLESLLSSYGSSYSKIASGYSGPLFSLGATSLLFPYLAFALPWINNAAAFSGEIKDINKSSITGTFLPVIVSGALLALFSAVYYSYLGFDFAMNAPNAWPEQLATAGATPNMLTIALIVIRNAPLLGVLISVLFSFWYLAASQQTILSVSRYVLGLSFDRLLPTRLAAVSERFHTPYASLLLTFVVSIPMVFIVALTNWTSLYSTTALGTLFFAFIGITAIVFGLKRPSSFEKAMLVLCGVVTTGFFLYLTYMFVALPYYGINDLSWGIMLFFWVLGALLYPISKWYHAKKGINLSLAFKELPPE